jgi:hypothetical protein
MQVCKQQAIKMDAVRRSAKLEMLYYNTALKLSPLTLRGGQYGCETLRLPQFLESQLTDGGEVFILAGL